MQVECNEVSEELPVEQLESRLEMESASALLKPWLPYECWCND